MDKKTFEVINPSTEEVITSVSEATEKDVDIAVAAARKAFNVEWRKTTPFDRSRLLNKLADLESREVLLGKLAGAFKASLFGAAYLFNAPLSQAVRTVEALREKQESAQ